MAGASFGEPSGWSLKESFKRKATISSFWEGTVAKNKTRPMAHWSQVRASASRALEYLRRQALQSLQRAAVPGCGGAGLDGKNIAPSWVQPNKNQIGFYYPER